MREASLEFIEFLDEVVKDDSVGLLVLGQQFLQPVELVAAEPNRLWRVDEPCGHLRELLRHHGGVDGHRSRVREARHEVLLHVLVGLAVGQVHPHLDRVQRRQLVLVLARLQHERRRLDPGHDQLQRTWTRLPVVELTVDEVEVLLLERALAAA